MIDNTEFLTELARGMPTDERMILCAFSGDPGNKEHRSWTPIPWRPGARAPRSDTNNYVAVSSFGRSPLDQSFRRQTALFKAGRALMVDDVGTKISPSVVDHTSPTARIETSPGNEQWWFFLNEPCTDQVKFDGVIRAFIERQLLGADPGMAGVNRVGRLPVGRNGKPKHNGWQCRCVSWKPKLRWSIETLREAFQLPVVGDGRPTAHYPGYEQHIAQAAKADGRVHQFATLLNHLRRAKMVKTGHVRLGNWFDIRCPWIEQHSDGADSGAAISIPSAENEWWGAFQCHHGHCVHRRMRDVMEWLNDELAETLDAANAQQQ